MVERIQIAEYFKNATINHPLYTAMAEGTLPLKTFKALIQQDNLYVDNFFHEFGILAKREIDLERKKYIQSVADGNMQQFFDKFYVKFNFSKGVHMVPTILGNKQNFL